jgi:hypothetical protein
MIKCFILLALYVGIVSNCFSQNGSWLKSFGFISGSSQKPKIIKANTFAGSFVMACRYDTAGFAWDTVPYHTNNPHIYLSKMDKDGNYTWHKKHWYVSMVEDFDLTPEDNIITVGRIREGLSFEGEENKDYDRGFVSRFDKDGELLNQFFFSEAFVKGIATDKKGNYFLALSVKDSLFIKGQLLRNNYEKPIIYILKFDKTDNLLWYKNTAVGDSIQICLSSDTEGNIILAGSFQSQEVFLFDSLKYYKVNGLGNGFISKLGADGSFLWSHEFKTFVYSFHLKVNAKNEICVSGIFKDKLSLEDHFLIEKDSTYWTNDIFVTKITKEGSVKWLKQINCGNEDILYGFDITSNGTCFISGNIWFKDLNVNDEIVQNFQNSLGTYILELDNDGKLSDITISYGSAFGYGLTTITEKSLLIWGKFNHSMHLDEDTLISSNWSSFIAYYSFSNQLVNTNAIQTSKETKLKIYPNPSNGLFTLEISDLKPGCLKVSLFNAMGQLLHQEDINHSGHALKYIEITKQNSGLIFIRAENGEFIFTEKITLH